MMALLDFVTDVRDSSLALGLDFALSGRGGREYEQPVLAPQ